MPTDPNPSLAPKSPSETLPAGIAQALAAGLGNFSLRELLVLILNSLSQAERQAYLAGTPTDKGNGSYARSLKRGSIPSHIDVPPTRGGSFRPRLLPAPYQRDYPEETQALLLNLLASCRSLNAAKAALHKMGLAASEEVLEDVAHNFIEELELQNSRPLDPDLLTLFLDAKFVEVREGDRLRPGAIYLVVGLGRDRKKRILASLFLLGRENLEEWKNVLRGLIERGLRRVALVVHDDFSGLLPITRSLFPQADIQLGIVHLQRHAKSHLTKTDATEFNQRIRTLKAAWNAEVAPIQFEDLCQRFQSRSPSFIRDIRKKREHYLASLNYPDVIRRSLSTTNVVEAINGPLEIMRRNSGGYFHSEETLKLKLGLAVSQLETGRWRRVASSFQSTLAQFNALFQARFETKESLCRQTQNS